MSIGQPDMPASSSDERALTITPPGEFSFAETLLFLRRSPLECLHRVVDGKVYKLLELEQEPALVEISASDSSLQLRFVDGRPRSQSACAAAMDYVRDWFDLRTDLAPFYHLAAGDPLLGRLTSAYAGLRIVGIPALFEALCWAVIGQQINLAFAYTLKQRFVQAYGRRVQWGGQEYWLFPQPREIAGVGVDALRQLQLTGKKAAYVIGIAERMASGGLSKAGLLASGDLRAAEAQLLMMRGIGPWTAHYVLMRCLRDPSAFPIGDAGLQNALKQVLQRAEKPGADEIRQIFAPWRNWEAYAVFYLWRTLASAPVPPLLEQSISQS